MSPSHSRWTCVICQTRLFVLYHLLHIYIYIYWHYSKKMKKKETCIVLYIPYHLFVLLFRLIYRGFRVSHSHSHFTYLLTYISYSRAHSDIESILLCLFSFCFIFLIYVVIDHHVYLSISLHHFPSFIFLPLPSLYCTHTQEHSSLWSRTHASSHTHTRFSHPAPIDRHVYM